MADLTPTSEGDIPFKVPGIDRSCFTHYKVFGELEDRTMPATVFLHGGPGAGHNGLLPFAHLWPDFQIPCIFYDQIGCGLSTHLPETAGDESLWNEELFMNELDNLIDHFDLREKGFNLLGHSFGGNMCAVYAARRPRGLRRLVLSSALASKELSVRGIRLCIEQMPSELQERMKEAEGQGDFESSAHKEALALLRRKHTCRTDPPPPELQASLKNLAEDRTVYTTMNGPSPLNLNRGSMRNWTSIPRLPLIQVPTFIYNGEYDTSHDIAQKPFFENIPKVRWFTFSGGGHVSHLEEGLREKVRAMVGGFLVQGNGEV